MTNTHNALSELRSEASAAEILLANYTDAMGDDAAASLDLISGETDVVEIIAALVDRIDEAASHCDSLKARISTMTERKRRLENQIDMIRSCIGAAMEQVEIKGSLELDVATVSVRKNAPKLAEIDMSELPTKYLTKTVSIAADKKALLADLKGGEQIPGAELAPESTTISIRRS